MKITEKIKRFLNRNNPELIADIVADSYQERKENGEKDPMDHTVEEIIQILRTHPDIKRAILANILENDKIPDKIFEKTAIKISESEEIPNSVITDVVQRNDTNISDESINRIIEGGKISVNERINLMRNVESQEIIESRIKNELLILYKICKNKKDYEVVERVEQLKELLNEDEVTLDIQKLIYKVVSKKMAENFYSDTKQGTKIFTFTKIEPLEDMIEKDIASEVENEYKKIEEEKQPKEGRFNKEEFETQLYRELGKQIGIRYEDTGVFIIPQSDNIKKMNEEQKTKFIKSIQTYARKSLTKDEIIDIDEQIRGISENSQMKEDTIIKLIKELPKEDKNKKIDMLTEILQDQKMYETIKQLKESALLETLKKLPKEKREKTIEAINNAVEKRNKYRAVSKTPKANDATLNIKTETNEEER